ncbi:MAG: hypothetical protein IT245_04140 [Bacteroidia bacterium]|nr:hypothetical protein [Bacteroidia bacterium]
MKRLITKHCIFLFALISTLSVTAQKNIDYPNSNQFETYLKQRSENIQKLIYEKILKGEFTLYKTDSIQSTYTLSELKSRSNYADNKGKVREFSPSDLKGIWFLKSYLGKFNDIKETTEMKAMALIFQPEFMGIKANLIPLVWLSEKELKLKLTENDYRFLSLLYNFGSNSSSNFVIDEEIEEPYFYNLYERLSFVKVDSILTRRITRTTVTNYCFMMALSMHIAPMNPDNFWVQDILNKRRIPLTEVGNTFYTNVPVFISTDPNDPTIGYDSSYNAPIFITHFNSAFFDSKTGHIIHFTYKNFYGSAKVELEIPRQNFTQFEPSEISLWLIEDYYRTISVE